MSFPRYPKYKASGVEWLGDVPEGWNIVPLKIAAFVAVSGIDKKFKDDEERIRFLGTDTVYSSERITTAIELEECSASEDQIRAFSLLAKDVVITKDSVVPTKIAVVSYVDQPPEQAVCGYHLALIRSRPGRAVGLFLFYALKSTALAAYFLSEARGTTIIGIGGGIIGKATVPLPPLPEQTAIAEFLDRETAKIDELVAEQRRLMELLKEKRQAVISNAVTKGLNPHAPMKHSGIEWMGEMPTGWVVKRLKHISPFIAVGIVVNPSTYIADVGLPFIYGGDIREGVIDFANARRITSESSEVNSKTLLRTGDLLTVRVGAPGVTAVVPSECDGGNCASVMLVRQGPFNSDWLCYAMNTKVVRFQVEVVKYGAAQEQFNISHAVNFWVPVPPRTEQDAIAAFLACETLRFDTLTAEAQRAIDLLQERRTALISAAVTGQIDVRQQARN
jgi:type I restriction enzyme S subunit